jgi:hypothetical protein
MTIEIRRTVLVTLTACAVCAGRLVEAQGLSGSIGVAKCFANGARCHESSEAPAASRTSVLKRMTPERILESLTVNSAVARGGSLASGGPIVANGMVFIGSGYPGFQGGNPGNVLLAPAPAVRLDVHADGLKKRATEGRDHEARPIKRHSKRDRR